MKKEQTKTLAPEVVLKVKPTRGNLGVVIERMHDLVLAIKNYTLVESYTIRTEGLYIFLELEPKHHDGVQLVIDTLNTFADELFKLGLRKVAPLHVRAPKAVSDSKIAVTTERDVAQLN